jgi:two-component system sensor histidine kinase AlgZ
MNSPAPGGGFLPSFCAIRMVFAVVVTAQLLAFVLTLADVAATADLWLELSRRSLYIQWVALGASAVLCVLRAPLNRLGHTGAGLLAWLIVVGVTALVYLAASRIGPGWGDAAGQVLLQHLGISGIVAAVVLRYLYEQHRERVRDAAEAQARFQALQARIRPHFLFNSMNTIANLTQADPALAEEVVHDLSDLFRASLSDAGRLSTLDGELALARGYLRIEAQRLGDRLRVEWDLEDLPGEAPLPALLLQPLLENAVYHGVEPARRGGVVRVIGRCRRGVVSLGIQNRLPPPGASERPGNRIALENIRERLEATFGDEAGLQIGRVDGQYQVRIYFPLRGPGT